MNVFIGIEIAVLVLFFLVLRDAIVHFKQDRKKLFLLLMSFVYILLFENLNMVISSGRLGDYFYNPMFTVFVGKVPLFMAMLWSFLLYTTMHLTDTMHVKQLRKPFMDSLAVLLIMLLFNIVLTRQGVITWIGYSSNHAWFGTPAGHLIAILFMTFAFSFLFRFLTRADNELINQGSRAVYLFLLPVFSYLIMLLGYSLVNFTAELMRLTKSGELLILWVLVIVFASLIRMDHFAAPMFRSDNHTIFLILFTRLLILFYVMWSVVLMYIYKETFLVPFIIIIATVSEILLYASAFEYKEPPKELEHY